MQLPSWVPSSKDLAVELAWLKSEVKRIGEEALRDLAEAAAKQRDHVYAPYSGYRVGVAVLAASGSVYLGNNVERASYSESDHGEEAAITNAVINGEVEKSGRKFLKALAVSHEGDSAPCGRCRQIMVEHADNCLVVTADPRGNIRRITSLKVLLPYAFTPSDLGIK